MSAGIGEPPPSFLFFVLGATFPLSGALRTREEPPNLISVCSFSVRLRSVYRLLVLFFSSFFHETPHYSCLTTS